jgi:redox-sensitive bicupin YhaK (pirin superfamily)
VIDLVVPARARDVAGLAVRRVLPFVARRHIGPFVFFDHMGPAAQRANVPPHIGLATVTYLFDGEIVHRDSVGSEQTIIPGDVNWMIAGRGVAHSEHGKTERVHGVQCWVALPLEHEETAPRFEHHAQDALPRIARDGAVLDVIAGHAYGERAPVSVFSPTLCVHAQLEPNARLAIDDTHEERAAYVVSGAIECEERRFDAGTLVVFAKGEASLRALGQAHVMLVGGARLDGERHIWWNFVSSSKDRIERAKREWQEDRFAKVHNDEAERMPLPSS